ncbi:DNA packaging protein UL33 [Eptesicus fuscus gammaherpesvirus]|uniref:DNA packaging protein UL33 n=1 Tax=vespertilionid gammaherpesvirus 3 TaxID=2846598 RepID=A0A2D0ZP19_9GAMA|nr:DNA packaging protein UL33 [Eptesicus fuscus gammaherpesvirus]ATA58299.1 DNA packaging protein UL33 [Eptesicus fuscus gammaherpesvirus]WAH70930.1 UL33 [Eptesicus fuscus gammaherpesvirus]
MERGGSERVPGRGHMETLEATPNSRDPDALDFEPMLPPDMRVIAPTIYARLNMLNYCQYLRAFERARAGEILCCEHGAVLTGKLEVIKQLISKIVDADSVFRSVDQNRPGR